MKEIIKNPILEGFHPDPCVVQVGNTCYLANSTFEWYPGVRIYESRDLKKWKLASTPLNRLSLLDMKGIGSSEGIWAPDLSWCNDKFYLVYTIVRNQGRIKDLCNYVIVAKNINGPWSEPVYLNSSGFDPSLFHDIDGRKWLLNMQWDYRKGNGPEAFTGILLQEFDEKEKRLVGEPLVIFEGSSLGYTEGPHLYRHGEYYYLMCAEGGTSYGHAVTIARSKKIDGPYEVDPQNPILTSNDECNLKKAGHASLFQFSNEEWYLAHLCGRPIPGTQYCVLGRETALQEVKWTEEGWLRLKNGKNIPEDFFKIEENEKQTEIHDSNEKWYMFDNESFWEDFQTLRIPYDRKSYSLKKRPGWLRLTGKESVQSKFQQTLLARRQTDFCFNAETKMSYIPTDFMHSAGLIYRYNENNLHYLNVTYQEKTVLRVDSIYDGVYNFSEEISVKGIEFILGIQVRYTKAQFYYKENDILYFVGDELDITNLSDDFTYGFTGAFIGICAQDLRDHKKYADFQWFRYEKISN